MDDRPDPKAGPRTQRGPITQDASSRLVILARAGELLAAAPTDWLALERLASLVVPALADWCAIDVVQESGRVARVAVVHTDPAKIEIAAELERRYPPNPADEFGVPKVLRTGVSELHPQVTDEQLKAPARADAHLELIRKLGGFRSAMIVPLLARGRTLGAISLVSAESGREFPDADLAVADALA